MRTPEEKIKAAILHPEEQIRAVAASYFVRAYSADPTIMPLLIESVEKYGRENAWSILEDAGRLTQTPATVEWLMRELERSYDVDDLAQDNYRWAVALLLCEADPHLLVRQKNRIPVLPAFPERLEDDLILQAKRAKWDWDTGWEALQEWAEFNMDEEGFGSPWEAREGSAIVRALGRLGAGRQDMVLKLLGRHYRGHEKDLMIWLEPQLVELGGEMKLEAAVPVLVERLHEDDEQVGDAVVEALTKIGTEEVVRALAKEWREGDVGYRFGALDVFGHIHGELSVATALKCLAEEKDDGIVRSLGYALLNNFADEAVEAVRELLRAKRVEAWPTAVRDLRWRLVAVATIMGQTFPEYEAWYREAVAEGWGRDEEEPYRLADEYEDVDDYEEDEVYEGMPLSEKPMDLFRPFESSSPASLPPPEPFVNKEPKVGRNDPCPCGSGKKYKKCCMGKESADPPEG